MNVLKRIFQFNLYNRDEWVGLQALKVPTGARVLDAGAGPGRYRTLFRHCNYQTQDFGQEPSSFGKYTRLDYESDITSIPVADGSFDVVLCTEVLEHVPEPIRAVQEFARVLRPGGRLIMTAPLGSRLHQEPYHFYGGFTQYWYRKFLPEAGFIVESIEPNLGFFSKLAQEASYYSTLIDPRRTGKAGLAMRLLLSCLWLVTLPLFRFILPLMGPVIDRFNLTADDTVGYHVVAIKRY